jgi:glycosyltransferase involved in cell wall biosynthesis
MPTAGGPVVLVNNSQETFTPTISGAIATCLWELCRSAATQGQEPVVVTTSSDAEPYPWPATRFVPPSTGPRGTLATKAERAARRLTGWARREQRVYAVRVVPVLRQIRPSVVVCNNDPELAVHLRRKLPDVTIVHWFHNLEVAADRPRRKMSVDRALVAVAVSAYLARAIETVYRMETLRVKVARNGVDSSVFRPADDRSDTDGAAVPVFGFVGRIGVEKAPDTFLRACLSLARQRDDFAVQLIGDTNWGHTEPTEIRRLVDELVDQLVEQGIEVRRPGHVPRKEIPDALRATDVHVVPSRWDEPFGLTTLEGLATGIPVVASATGGTPEVVGDAGILFPRDDVGSLTGALAGLLDDPGSRTILGAKARRRAESMTWLHTWQALVDATEHGGSRSAPGGHGAEPPAARPETVP